MTKLAGLELAVVDLDVGPALLGIPVGRRVVLGGCVVLARPVDRGDEATCRVLGHLVGCLDHAGPIEVFARGEDPLIGQIRKDPPHHRQLGRLAASLLHPLEVLGQGAVAPIGLEGPEVAALHDT